ncbi:scavenger receptor class F member 2-like [Crassostrea angulata]|uniref:scavenger receptor class F member 2-like n=1 Tax=Magallana angulata TaxID=2784310 RepID=UPI0022B15D6B|nr:scavenger receptor class F member 2-like [Crassostrea angulata]
MMTLFITLLILLQLSVKISMQICEGIYGTKCCNGYKWDFSHSKCIPCDNGFIGINCDIKCRYPWYGKNCQSVCDCDVPNCDYVNGCTKPTTNYKVHSTLHTNDKTVTKEQIKIYDVFSIKGLTGSSVQSEVLKTHHEGQNDMERHVNMTATLG